MKSYSLLSAVSSSLRILTWAKPRSAPVLFALQLTCSIIPSHRDLVCEAALSSAAASAAEIKIKLAKVAG